tara:strand:- start:1021 stop:1902 length:882 start_codon:yes stop_codon:yes gene_type:complete
MLNDIDIRNYRKNGYIILKNIYSTEQVARFRNIIKKEVTKDLGNESRDYQFLEQTHLKDVLSYSGLEEVILNEKLINALNGILDKQVVYWGFSSFRWNEKAYRRFHNDARNDTECPFTTKYPLVRVGVYLQDHSSFSNGLKIWKGSCNTLKYGRTLLKKIIFGKGSLKYLLPQQLYSSINVELEPGDAVIWNLRTCHSGMPIRVKYFQKTSFHPIIENFIEKFFPKLIIKSDVERAVLFSTFGAESKALENFVNYNLVHPETKNTLRNSNFLNNNLIKEKSEKLGLKLIDVLK